MITTTDLGRTYATYKKPEGFVNSVKGLWQRKYEAKIALLPTNLEIGRGEIVGLVGANGAGKTTLLKLLAGLIHPSSGDARVLGFQPWRRQNDFLRQISILLGQKAQLWWDIPAADSFALLGSIYGIERSEQRRRVADLADILSVNDHLHIQLRRLSLGERMKMELIGALLHRPRVLFLDEPTIGLDIVAQATIRKFISEYARLYEPTIILTSHYMDDIAQLASRLLLMSRGKIVYDGGVTEFTHRAGREIQQRVTLRLDAPARNAVVLGEHTLIETGRDIFSGEVRTVDVGSFLQKVAAQGSIAEIKIEETDFEDVIHRFLAAESSQRTPIA